MHRKLIALIAALCVTAFAFSPSVAAAKPKYKISIHYSAKQDYIYGTISASDRDCFDTRKLYVYFWDGDSWTGELHTTDVSGKYYYYGAMGGITEGKYYAKAPADKLTGCDAVQSETIRVR